MSSILLSNPFVTPFAPHQSGPIETANTQLLAPAQGASGGGNANNATSYSGSGGGYGSGKGAPTSFAMRATSERGGQLRLSNATSNSVVNAQAQDNKVDWPAFGSNLPEVDMPDPLPTSPFLLAMRDAR